MSNKEAAAASTNDEPITSSSLFEAAVAGRWEELSSLCDQYSHPHDAPLNPNPLFAAVLHTAILMAAKHQSATIFADVAPKEMVNTAGLQLSIEDFCPYLTFEEGDAERRSRRRAIAKLCRVNPKWISNPLVGTSEKNADTKPMSGTTCLHLAVRMRCPALVKLLLKYCPTSARVPDDFGYLPLHYAVRPADEIQVYNKAIAMHKARTSGTQSGLVPPSDLVNGNIPNDAGGGAGGGVSFGMRMVNRGKQLLCGMSEVAMLTRFRVNGQNFGSKRKKCIATKRKLVSAKISESTASKAVGKEVHNPTRRSSRIKKNDEIQQAKATEYLLFSNLYSSPSSLVRAMTYLGCIEEDSPKFISAESQASSADYPMASASRGLMRASRPWKRETHRLAVVRALTDVFPEGMAVACNHDEETDEPVDWNDSKAGIGGGGDTPFIIAVRTFKSQLGEDDDDEDFNMNMMNMDGGGNGNGDDAAPPGFMGGFNHENVAAAAAAPNEIENAADETGEEDADYEADLLAKEDVYKTSDEKSPADAEERAPPAELPAGNNQEEEPNPDDPLETIRTMIAAARRINDFTSLSTANDDGDTPLHMATRIGVNRRLVGVLLNAHSAPASMRAKDNCTPLHLIVRRCSHLAPEGVGGLATYDADTVQLMVNAAGRDPMCWFNDETRTPMHEACYYGASPEVLELLATSEGGGDAMLMRDSEGHAPLGAYCRHAADFYGMRVLVNHCPQAAAAMADGRRLPIHRVLAAFNLAVNVDVLNLLGRAYPRGVYAKDSHGMTPLALLGQSYKGPMNVDLPKLHANRTTLGRCLSNKVMLMARYLILNGKANKEWNRSHMVIGQDDDGDETRTKPKERLLHAAVRDPASSDEIVQLAIILDPKQLKVQDEDGNTPLHLCCLRESGCTEYTVFQEVRERLEESDDDSVFEATNSGISVNEDPLPLETSEASGKRALTEGGYDPDTNFIPILHSVLKREFSAARMRNNEGNFPLQILIDRGASWSGGGIDQVFKANPGAIFSYDLSNTVVVKAMGRVSRVSKTPPEELKREEAACLGSMYELIRGKPTVLEGANVEMLGDPKVFKQHVTRRSKRLRTH